MRAEKENRAADLVQEEIVHEIKNGYSLKHAKPIMVILPIVVVFATLFGTWRLWDSRLQRWMETHSAWP